MNSLPMVVPLAVVLISLAFAALGPVPIREWRSSAVNCLFAAVLVLALTVLLQGLWIYHLNVKMATLLRPASVEQQSESRARSE